MNPDAPQIPIYLAEVFNAQGKPDEAKQLLVEARDRMPGLIKMSGLGTTRDASRIFGGSAANVLTAFRQLQHELAQRAGPPRQAPARAG